MECQEDISYLLTSKDVILQKCRESFSIKRIDFLESYIDEDLMESEVSDTII